MSVIVPVSQFDRGRADHANIMGVVTEKTDDNQHTIATKHGKLNGTFCRNQFEPCKQKVLSYDELNTDTVISLRSAAKLESNGTEQGYSRCNCTGLCSSRRCLCFKSGAMCSSHCHPRNAKCSHK